MNCKSNVNNVSHRHHRRHRCRHHHTAIADIRANCNAANNWWPPRPIHRSHQAMARIATTWCKMATTLAQRSFAWVSEAAEPTPFIRMHILFRTNRSSIASSVVFPNNPHYIIYNSHSHTSQCGRLQHGANKHAVTEQKKYY